MEKLTLSQISEYSRGRMRGAADTLVSGVSTDTRTIEQGDLFVALRGERFNGHDYLEEAFRRGAVAALVEEAEMADRPTSAPLIFVDDVLTGLQSMARNYRATLQVKTVAVAGSNGKTGTKEMVAAVLGVKFPVLKNKGNLNNHIGVPISMLRLDGSHRIGVFEVGTNHPGELLQLLELVRPVAGIITTIGEEHLEYFHDLEGVAKEEGTLAEILPQDGLLVLNADDPWSESIARRSRAPVATFGLGAAARYRASDICLSMAGTGFKMTTPRGTAGVTLRLIGRHQVSNALAAAAVGEFFGLEPEEIREGLESVTPAKMRMEWKTTRNGVLVINDAYNANPSSMRAALDALREISIPGRRVAVLGEMRELGAVAESSHRAVGVKAAECGLDMLLVVGEGASGIVEGATHSNTRPHRVEFFKQIEPAREFLQRETKTGDAVLVKASRGPALERILEGWN